MLLTNVAHLPYLSLAKSNTRRYRTFGRFISNSWFYYGIFLELHYRLA